jgi:hypothetical protein
MHCPCPVRFILLAWLLAGGRMLAANPPERLLDFVALDTDRDGRLSAAEWHSPAAAIGMLPMQARRRLFAVLDADADGSLSPAEFEHREAALLGLLGDLALRVRTDDPADPGASFVPFDPRHPFIDDAAVFGAVFHRHRGMLASAADLPMVDLDQVPLAFASSRSPWRVATDPAPQPSDGVDDLIAATLVIAAGEGDDFFTAGAVLVNPDGLAITNFHVAEWMGDGMTAMTSDGRIHRVVELLAADDRADTALIRLDGAGFPAVPLAPVAPPAGTRIRLLHHTENRFYTFDQGTVSRYSLIDGIPTLEISAAYAPGGSGCGIFDEQHRLVGLVASIAVGDGPSLAEGAADPGGWEDPIASDMAAGLPMDALVVKHAVPWQALRSLWQGPDDTPESRQPRP